MKTTSNSRFFTPKTNSGSITQQHHQQSGNNNSNNSNNDQTKIRLQKQQQQQEQQEIEEELEEEEQQQLQHQYSAYLRDFRLDIPLGLTNEAAIVVRDDDSDNDNDNDNDNDYDYEYEYDYDNDNSNEKDDEGTDIEIDEDKGNDDGSIDNSALLLQKPSLIKDCRTECGDGIKEKGDDINFNINVNNNINIDENVDNDDDIKDNYNCNSNSNDKDSNDSTAVVVNNNINPFASFAYDNFPSSSLFPPRKRSHTAMMTTTATAPATRKITTTTIKTKTAAQPSKNRAKKEKKTLPIRCKKDTTNGTIANKKHHGYFDPANHTPEEKARIIQKWQAMSDPRVSIEQRRFQVLVAARLSCQAKECVVQRDMDRLGRYLFEKDGGRMNTTPTSSNNNNSGNEEAIMKGKGYITVERLSRADPTDIAKNAISSVLFANAKAKQIVKAANEILSQHNGIVPENRCSLVKITGIGPALAGLLCVVNSRDAYMGRDDDDYVI